MATVPEAPIVERETDVRPERILELAFGYWSAKTVLSAVGLGLFAELARSGSVEGEELRTRLGLHPRSARDFFDALVALGLLERDNGRYANAADAELFLDPAKPSYIGGLLELGEERAYDLWGRLTEALLTGKPQNALTDAHGDFFTPLYADPERLRVFMRGMTGSSLGVAHALAQKFPWHDQRIVIDIGCAEGAVPVAIALAHDHISGGGLDLPPVQPIFEEYVARAGLSERLRFHPGDFFADDPLPEADVLILGHVLHDWGLDEKKSLLRKAHDALPRGGTLIVYETLIDDERRENVVGLLMSLTMLLETADGFDYTGPECEEWMREVGFDATRVEHLIGPHSMVVGRK